MNGQTMKVDLLEQLTPGTHRLIFTPDNEDGVFEGKKTAWRADMVGGRLALTLFDSSDLSLIEGIRYGEVDGLKEYIVQDDHGVMSLKRRSDDLSGHLRSKLWVFEQHAPVEVDFVRERDSHGRTILQDPARIPWAYQTA